MAKKYILFLLIPVICSCSSIQVTYDYNKNIDFSEFKTYAFTSETQELPITDIDFDRVIKAVENEMESRGYTASKEPDVAFDLHLKTKEMYEASAMVTGSSYGPYRYGGGFSTTNVSYYEYTDGTLFISIVNMKTEQLIWQGTGTKQLDPDMTPEQREKSINYSIKQILSNYPPSK